MPVIRASQRQIEMIETSRHHWHEAEDELVYVLDGEITVVEGEMESLLGRGDAAAFPKWHARVG